MALVFRTSDSTKKASAGMVEMFFPLPGVLSVYPACLLACCPSDLPYRAHIGIRGWSSSVPHAQLHLPSAWTHASLLDLLS